MNKKTIMIIALIAIGIFIIIKIATPNTSKHKRTGKNDIDRAIVSIYKSNDFKEGNYSFDDDLHEISHQNAIALKLSNIERDAGTFYYQSKYVEEDDIGEKLEKRTVSFRDNSEEAEVEIYKIKNISDKVAIALKTEYWSGYYLYINGDYDLKDINEFIEVFGINKDTRVLRVDFYVYNKDARIEYGGVTNEYFFENILSKAGGRTEFSVFEDEITGVNIWLSIGSLGERINIEIVENGDIYIGGILGGYIFIFKGGENGVSNVVDFVNYINDNYEGKITYFDK